MEIFFSIIAGIFAIIASVFGVRNRLGNRNDRSASTRGGSNLRDERSRYNDTLSDYQELERNKERIRELDRRDDDCIKECNDIKQRIRKGEQETDSAE